MLKMFELSYFCISHIKTSSITVFWHKGVLGRHICIFCIPKVFPDFTKFGLGWSSDKASWAILECVDFSFSKVDQWQRVKKQEMRSPVSNTSFPFWGEFTIILSKKKKALMFPMICLLTFIEEWTVGPWQRSTEPSSLFSAPFLWNWLSWKAWRVLVTMLLTQ